MADSCDTCTCGLQKACAVTTAVRAVPQLVSGQQLILVPSVIHQNNESRGPTDLAGTKQLILFMKHFSLYQAVLATDLPLCVSIVRAVVR